jgi:hypothetical protein
LLTGEYVLYSYPRSGSNYFQEAWIQKTQTAIPCFRETKIIKNILENYNFITLALIRDPIDSIASRTLISIEHEKTKVSLDDFINYSILEYKKIYQIILDNAKYIININDFDKIDMIIDKIYNKKMIAIDEDLINNNLSKIPTYSPTFKEHDQYEELLQIVGTKDIEECYFLYWAANEKRIMV